ncbi:MAG: phosphotransferase family protein [Candidatus Kerfeldbacteria bacterium]
MNLEVASPPIEVEKKESPSTPEFSVEQLRQEVPEVFDFDYIKDLLNDGGAITEQEFKSLAAKHDGSLEKYLIKYETENGIYYLTRNTNYQIKPAFDNLSVVHQALPEGSVPRPVAYSEKLDALAYEELAGENFVDALVEADETKRLEFFRQAGELTKKLHSVDTKDIHRDSNEVNSSIEMIMQTINADSFEEIRAYDPEFYQGMKAQYDILVAREKEIRESEELVINHGDLHPGNLLATDGDNVGMVDFTDVAIAPRARDVGGFLEQTKGILEYRNIANEEQFEQYKEAFLEGYGQDMDIKKEDIDFYQAWQAWRNGMYFATKIPPDMEGARATMRGVEQKLSAL